MGLHFFLLVNVFLLDSKTFTFCPVTQVFRYKIISDHKCFIALLKMELGVCSELYRVVAKSRTLVVLCMRLQWNGGDESVGLLFLGSYFLLMTLWQGNCSDFFRVMPTAKLSHWRPHLRQTPSLLWSVSVLYPPWGLFFWYWDFIYIILLGFPPPYLFIF